MTKYKIGIGGAHDEAEFLDLEALVGSHLCIQGNSGAGKSGAIRRILEVTHGKIQQIVLDVEDEFHTLRESLDYVVAGGDNGDCAATPANAGSLALAILRGGFSAVVQINNLEISDRRQFVADFLGALLAAPKDLWRPLLVVLDEAQEYAPQVGSVESSAAVVSLMTRGRKRGFTGILATPRISAISKDALSAVNNWLMGRVGQPVDRRTTADALGFRANSEEARGLQKLPPRVFWSFGRALSSEPRLLRIDQTDTTIVKAGQATIPTPPAPAAMAKILEALNKAAAPPADLKPPTTGSGVKPAPGSFSKSDIDAEYTRGRADGFDAGALSLAAAHTEAVMALQDEITSTIAEIFTEYYAKSKTGMVKDGRFIEPDGILKSQRAQEATAAMLKSMRALRGDDADNSGFAAIADKIKKIEKPRAARAPGQLAGAAMALLSAMARYPDRGLTWHEAAIVAGQRSGNGHFNTGKKSLIDAGMVREIEGGRFVPAASSGITMENHGKLTRAALVALWSGKLKSPAPAMLEYFAKHHNQALTTDALANGTGFKSGNGHWNTGIKSLRTAGLVEQDGRTYQLAPFLREAR